MLKVYGFSKVNAVALCRRGHRPGVGGTSRLFADRSTDMSADRDRGIRREKQKRAKAQKKLARRSRDAGTAPGATRTPASARDE